MVKLKERKLKWALRQKDKKNEHLAYLCRIKVRRFQQLREETLHRPMAKKSEGSGSMKKKEEF